MDNKTIHIGEIIGDRLKKKGQTKKWLAEQVNCDPSNFSKILKKGYMSTDLLKQITFVLEHDFFKYFSDYYAECQCNNTDNGE
jgi:plasmid maintenance system antidote protein VapI